MKKLLCVLLVLCVTISLAACGENLGFADKKVTIYVMDTISAVDADGKEQLTLTYSYEEGWQEKESFTVNAEAEVEEQKAVVTTMVYGERSLTQETANTTRTETVYDQNGRAISSTNTYLNENSAYEKTETTYGYDEMGRMLFEETKTYLRGEGEQGVQEEKITYTYTETETGSECKTDGEGPVVYVRIYNKDNLLVKLITMMGEEEVSRTEYEHDEAGNVIKMSSYIQGEKVMETRQTWKTVEVSAEFAERFPQFKRAK